MGGVSGDQAQHRKRQSGDPDHDEDEVEEGEIISCPECGVELEVVNTDPLEVELIGEEEEEEEDAKDDVAEDKDEEDEEEEEEDWK